MKKLLYLLGIVLLLTAAPTFAQALEWSSEVAEQVGGSLIPQNAHVLRTEQDGLFGLTDAEGNVILEPVYKDIQINADTIRIQDQQNHYGYLDGEGKLLIEPKYDEADAAFVGGVALVGRDFGYTIVNRAGEELLPLQPVRLAVSPDNAWFLASQDGTAVIWDNTGKQVAELPYNAVLIHSLSAITVEVEGKQGMVDSAGNVVIPAQYDELSVMGISKTAPENEVIRGVREGRVYWFRLDGSRIGDQAWEATGSFYVGTNRITIAQDGKTGLMDKEGTVLIEPVYDKLSVVCDSGAVQEDIVAVQSGGKTGLLKWDGAAYCELVPLRWGTVVNPDYLWRMGDGSISIARQVIRDDGSSTLRYGLIGADGNVWLEPVYALVIWDEETNRLMVKDVEGKTVELPETWEPKSDALLCEDLVRAEAQELAASGILKGDETGDLRLWETITRAEFVTLLSRADGWDLAAAPAAQFPDAQEHWAASAIAIAVEKGLVQGGTDGLFRPDDPVTYEEAYTILLRALGMPEEAWNGSVNVTLRTSRFAGIKPYPGSYGLAWNLPRDNAAKFIYDYLHTEVTPEQMYDYLHPVVE